MGEPPGRSATGSLLHSADRQEARLLQIRQGGLRQIGNRGVSSIARSLRMFSRGSPSHPPQHLGHTELGCAAKVSQPAATVSVGAFCVLRCPLLGLVPAGRSMQLSLRSSLRCEGGLSVSLKRSRSQCAYWMSFVAPSLPILLLPGRMDRPERIRRVRSYRRGRLRARRPHTARRLRRLVEPTHTPPNTAIANPNAVGARHAAERGTRELAPGRVLPPAGASRSVAQ